MTDLKWLEVASTASIEDGDYKIISLPLPTSDLKSNLEIAVFNINNQFFAIENRCPHQNLPLADGPIANLEITCPFHGAVFSLTTGEVKVNPGASCDNLQIFPVKIENDLIKISI